MAIRLALAALLLAVSASATMAQSQQERQACSDDAMQFCGDFVPDHQQVYRCLLRQVRRITPDCRKVILRYRNEQRRR